jgi:2,3-bisphosphoglycerate-dependent phosphoglycerate mutase
MPSLVLVRHGESLWNLENRFTGWVDVPLTDRGREEARQAAERLRDLRFDVAYTSVLSRAQETLDIMLEVLGQRPPVIRDAALNERHYGELQGLNKKRTAERYGDEQVHLWRRSYDVPPPGGEALKNVLVVAHGNSNRSIVMKLDGLSKEQVLQLNLGTGVPLVYEMSPEGEVLAREIRE